MSWSHTGAGPQAPGCSPWAHEQGGWTRASRPRLCPAPAGAQLTRLLWGSSGSTPSSRSGYGGLASHIPHLLGQGDWPEPSSRPREVGGRGRAVSGERAWVPPHLSPTGKTQLGMRLLWAASLSPALGCSESGGAQGVSPSPKGFGVPVSSLQGDPSVTPPSLVPPGFRGVEGGWDRFWRGAFASHLHGSHRVGHQGERPSLRSPGGFPGWGRALGDGPSACAPSHTGARRLPGGGVLPGWEPPQSARGEGTGRSPPYTNTPPCKGHS